MSADVNKSIEISLRANLKQLQDSLARIPGMTKKEAQAMTRALASEFNKSQRAAKKAAEESKKAARETAKEYKRSSEKIKQSFRDQADQARRSSKDMKKSFDLASQGIRTARRNSREFGAAMGSLEDVVSFINPELGMLAGQIGAAGQAARSMSRSLATGNIVLIGIVGTLALAAVAYTAFTYRTAKAREAFEKLKKGMSETRKETQKLSKELQGLGKDLESGFKFDVAKQFREIRKLETERLFITGQISQKEFDIAQAKFKQEATDTDLYKRKEQLLKTANEQFEVAQKSLVLEQKHLKELYEVEKGLKLGSKERMEVSKMIDDNRTKQEQLRKIIDDHPRLLKRIQRGYMDTLNEASKILTAETKIIEAKHKQKRITEAQQRAEERRQRIIAITSGLTDQINALEAQNEDIATSMLSKADQIRHAAKARRDALDEQLARMSAQVTEIELTAKTEAELLGLEEARLQIERASEAVKEQKRLITEKEKADLAEINNKLDSQKKKQTEISQIAKLRQELERTQLNSMLDALPISEEQFVNETKLGLKKRDTIDKINEATEAALNQAKTQEEIDAANEDRKRAMRAAELTHEIELQKIRDEAERKREEQLRAGTTSILQSMSTVTTASLELLQKSGNKNKKLMTALFMAQKVAAVGEIAMNTAKSITAAPAQFGALAPAAIAGYIAMAAAQTAVVMSQQPPKFHMGGVIERTPDESTIIVKRGEAVLDRATVNRLGGEQGVNRLQNGQTMTPQVIVMNPFKHYDRFIADRQRMGLSEARNARRGY